MENPTTQDTAPDSPRWRPYHGALFFVGTQAALFGLGALVQRARSGGGSGGRSEEDAYYEAKVLPRFAPPAWAFAPAWTVNNIASTYGLLRVLNKPHGEPGRSAYLTLQAVYWLNYVLFNAAFFGLRSPVNSAVMTALDLPLLGGALLVAERQLGDRKVALSLAPTLAWLVLAVPTSYLQARWNRDDWWNVGPFETPDPRRVKGGEPDEG